MWRRHHDPRAIEAVVRADVAHWEALDADERVRLLDGAERLLARKHWEAAGGLELDDGVRGVVAGLASLLVLGRDVDDLREVSAIVVYPSGVVTTGTWAGPVPGTLVDTRSRFPRPGGRPRPGDHRLGPGAGRRSRPGPQPQRRAARVRPQARRPRRPHGRHAAARPVGARPLDRRVPGPHGRHAGRQRHPPLRPYAATNPSEFFAVATESFFDRRVTCWRPSPSSTAC